MNGETISFMSPEDHRLLYEGDFCREQYRFNMLCDIASGRHTAVKSLDNGLIAMTCADKPLWVWVKADAARIRRIASLATFLRQYASTLPPLAGIASDPEGCSILANLYGGNFSETYEQIAYYCPTASDVTAHGRLICPSPNDLLTIAEFVGAFNAEAFNIYLNKKEMVKTACALLASGRLYGWYDERIVSMGFISMCNAKTARLNLIYTAAPFRRRGYAKGMITSLSKKILKDGLVPVLYTDVKNVPAGKLYTGSGFIDAGIISHRRV